MSKRLCLVPMAFAGLVAVASPAAMAGIASNCGLPATKTAGNCTAPTLVGGATGSGLRKDNKLFAGINWNFGKSSAELVVGFRHLRVQSNKDVEGAKLDFTLPFSTSGIGFDKLRLRYVSGTRDVQGEAGGGFSFQSGKPLLGAEVQGPYVLGGLDYVIGGGFQPYVGVNSLGKPKLPTLGSASQVNCTTGTLTSTSVVDFFITDPTALIVQNQTCFQEVQLVN